MQCGNCEWLDFHEWPRKMLDVRFTSRCAEFAIKCFGVRIRSARGICGNDPQCLPCLSSRASLVFGQDVTATCMCSRARMRVHFFGFISGDARVRSKMADTQSADRHGILPVCPHMPTCMGTFHTWMHRWFTCYNSPQAFLHRDLNHPRSAKCVVGGLSGTPIQN